MFILVFLYIALPLFQLAVYLNGQLALGFFDILNFACSIIAFHWLLTNVIVSTKIPALLRSAPYDVRIRFHILGSAGIIGAVAYHAVYKIVIGMHITPVSWILGGLLLMMLCIGILWIPLPGFTTFRKNFLERFSIVKKLTYDRAKSWHGFFVIALSVLLFIHIADAGLFSDVPAWSALLYAILLFAAIVLYLLSRTGLFRVGATVVKKEVSQGILTLDLRPDHPFKYRSGQFAFLRARNAASGKMEAHPFSFLSIPGEDIVRFAIRVNGDFTGELAALESGARVSINGPYGKFRTGNEKALCFIASGIGTVPLISLLKGLHAVRDTRPLHVFLAVTREGEIPDLDRVRQITAEMPNVNLRVLVYSVDGILYNAEYFRKELPDPAGLSYYLCSSPGVRTVVERALKEVGVKHSAIHFEAFSFG